MATTQIPIQGVFDTTNGRLTGIAATGGVELNFSGSTKVLQPVPYVEPAVTPETVTIAYGPSADGSPANTEYAALGTPTYRFDRAVDLPNSLRRVELEGVLRADRVEEGFGTRLDFSLGATTTTPYFVQGRGMVRFVTQSPTVTLVSYPNAALKCRILVDERRLAGSDTGGYLTGPVATTGGRPNWITLTFPDARPRVISYQANNIKSIFLGSGYYAAPPYAIKESMLELGDSFLARICATGEAGAWGNMGEIAGKMLGLNVVNIAQGGTGWVSTAGATRYNFGQGLAWLKTNAPAYSPTNLLFWSTGNDWNNREELQAKVTSTLLEALSYYPNVKRIVVTGVYGGFNTDSMAADLTSRIRAGVEAVGDSRIVYVPMHTPETDEPLFTGTGSVADPKGDGNSDVYLSSASQGAGDRHPNRAGVLYAADYLAKRIYAALKSPAAI